MRGLVVDQRPERAGITELPERSLHLWARSADDQRLWYIGSPGVGDPEDSTECLRLTVRPDRHETFASLESILGQLAPHAVLAQRDALRRISDYLAQVRPGSPDSGGGRGRLLTDSVTFAIMRRVSRESYYTARVIELAARVMNGILARLPYRFVVVEHADRLDRPTLKVLARAMLLLERAHRFSWVWLLDCDPTTGPDCVDDLYVASRSDLLRQLMGILRPSVMPASRAAPAVKPPAGRQTASIETMAAELVMQNYDRCFLLAPALERDHDADTTSEALRLSGLAAINVGRAEDALTRLHAAEEGSGVGRRAHLAYLQGLIEGKRRYDLIASDEQYRRGLLLLESGADPAADVGLERGWLFNGLALNQAIVARRGDNFDDGFAKAFALEQDAFELVREGSSPARMYLRFNLLANSGLLMEMAGNFDTAIEIFEKTFDFDVDRNAVNQSRWVSSMGYRIGLLQHRAGRSEDAYRVLYAAAEQNELVESWPVKERILRGLGAVAARRGSDDEAAVIYGEGLKLCREARAAEGACEHARGLISTLMAADRADEAREALAELQAEEGWPLPADAEDVRPREPSPKLPPYYPEIDLEGVPSIDLNRFLATMRTEHGPWRR